MSKLNMIKPDEIKGKNELSLGSKASIKVIILAQLI